MANRQGASALTAPVRPVSARTYMRNDEGPAASMVGITPWIQYTLQLSPHQNSGLHVYAGPMPLQSFKSYRNDLFGDEEGDVLAGETIPAKPIQVTVPRPTTPSGRVQQQIALNQQKRLARLQVIAAVLIGLVDAGCTAEFCLIKHSAASWNMFQAPIAIALVAMGKSQQTSTAQRA